MRPFVAEAELNHAIDRVFAYVSDSRNDPEWCPFVKDVRQTTGRKPKVGAVYVQKQLISKHEVIDSRIEVVAMEPPKEGRARIEWFVEDAVRTYRIEMEFLASEDGADLTLVRQISHPHFKQWKTRLKAALGRRYVGKVLATQMRRLDKALAASE